MIIIYTIPNWEKYNRPTSEGSLDWFKVSVRLYQDPKVQNLTNCQFRLWITMLCLYANSGRTELELNTDWIRTQAGLVHNWRRTHLSLLHDSNLIKILNIEEYTGNKKSQINANCIKKRREEKRREENRQPTVDGSHRGGRQKKQALEKKELKKAKKHFEPIAEDIALAKEWLLFAQDEMPWQKSFTSERFGQAIAEIRIKTKMAPTGLRQVFEFIVDDDFWRKNAVSPVGLLKKSSNNDNRKIDNILLGMRKNSDRVAKSINQWASSDKSSEAWDILTKTGDNQR